MIGERGAVIQEYVKEKKEGAKEEEEGRRRSIGIVCNGEEKRGYE